MRVHGITHLLLKNGEIKKQPKKISTPDKPQVVQHKPAGVVRLALSPKPQPKLMPSLNKHISPKKEVAPGKMTIHCVGRTLRGENFFILHCRSQLVKVDATGVPKVRVQVPLDSRLHFYKLTWAV